MHWSEALGALHVVHISTLRHQEALADDAYDRPQDEDLATDRRHRHKVGRQQQLPRGADGWNKSQLARHGCLERHAPRDLRKARRGGATRACAVHISLRPGGTLVSSAIVLTYLAAVVKVR